MIHGGASVSSFGEVGHMGDYSRQTVAVKKCGNDMEYGNNPSVVYARFDEDGCLRPFGRSGSNAPNPVSSCDHWQCPEIRIILSLPCINPS
jgi:hypothetical protein